MECFKFGKKDIKKILSKMFNTIKICLENYPELLGSITVTPSF